MSTVSMVVLGTISSALGCFDGLRVLELRAPDVVPEFGCYTETVAATVSGLR